MRIAIGIAAMLAALAADAVVTRKLPPLTVVESETVATDAMKATSVRSSNVAVFGAALREIGFAGTLSLETGPVPGRERELYELARRLI